MNNETKTIKLNNNYELDPRMKLLIVILVTSSLITASNIFVLSWIFIIIAVLFMCIKSWKGAGKTLFTLLICIILEIIITFLPKNKVMAVIAMIFFFFQRIIAAYSICLWMATNLRINDFVTALQKMHIPKGGTISFAVIFRYIPTVQNEFRSIKNTMKLRGIGFTPKNIFFHPLKTFEYAVVPLLLRSMTIADELAASAMTRGLDLDTKRSSYRTVKLCSKDYFYTLLVIIALAAGPVTNYLVQNYFTK